MFGSEEILAFIRRQIGIRTDPADPLGSLHAKVKYGNDNNVSILAKAPWNGKIPVITQGYNNSSMTGDSQYHELLRIDGPRIILGGWLQLMANSQRLYYTLSINGQNLLDQYNSQSLNTSSTGPGPKWTGSDLNFRMPIGYNKSYQYTTSSGYWYSPSIGGVGSNQDETTGGTLIVFPPLTPIQTSLVVSAMVVTNYSASPVFGWGIWHVAA